MGDAAKFQFSVGTLSIPHAPGFPLYILTGWLWTQFFPFLTTATAVTLFSVACMSGAMIPFRRSLQLCGVPRVATCLVTFAAALGGYIWLAGIEPGPTSFGVLMATAGLYFLLRWYLCACVRDLGIGVACVIVAGSLVMTYAWWIPCVVVWSVCVRARSWRFRAPWIGIATGLILVCVGYLFIYYRSHTGAPLREYVHENVTLSRLVLYALGEQFWPNWWWTDWGDIRVRLQDITWTAVREYHLIGAFLFFNGAIVLWRRFRAMAVLYAVCLIVSLLSVIHMFYPQQNHMYYATVPALFLGAHVYGIGVILSGKKAWVRTHFLALLLFGAACVHMGRLYHTRFGGETQWALEKPLLSLTPGATLVTDDPYALQEVLRYYQYNNRFIRQRDIRIADQLQFGPGITNFFLTPSVASLLDDAGIAYYPYYTATHVHVYYIGGRHDD